MTLPNPATDVLRRASAADLPAVVALQQAAYARNRTILGVEPLPLLADYIEILRDYEVWVAGLAGGPLRAVLVLAWPGDHLLIWSVASAPEAHGKGYGNWLLEFAELRALQEGRLAIRLYTGAKLRDNIAWYRRRGYAVERIEAMPDRDVVHMIKTLATGA